MAKEDAFDPQLNGTVKFVIDGIAFTLRRPKIKEFRIIRESLMEMGKPEEKTDGTYSELDHEEREDALLKWWNLVFETLGNAEKELPPNDDLPLWLFDSEIIPSLMAVWMKSPQVRGLNQ